MAEGFRAQLLGWVWHALLAVLAPPLLLASVLPAAMAPRPQPSVVLGGGGCGAGTAGGAWAIAAAVYVALMVVLVPLGALLLYGSSVYMPRLPAWLRRIL